MENKLEKLFLGYTGKEKQLDKIDRFFEKEIDKKFPDVLENIAIKYIESCDRYDQLNCSGRNKHGEVIPINNKELGIINRYAKLQLKIAYENGIKEGFTQIEVWKAIKYFITK